MVEGMVMEVVEEAKEVEVDMDMEKEVLKIMKLKNPTL